MFIQSALDQDARPGIGEIMGARDEIDRAMRLARSIVRAISAHHYTQANLDDVTARLETAERKYAELREHHASAHEANWAHASTVDALAEAEAKLETAERENKRLEAELDASQMAERDAQTSADTWFGEHKIDEDRIATLTRERDELVELVSEFRKAVAFAGAEGWDGGQDMQERLYACDRMADHMGVKRPTDTAPRAAQAHAQLSEGLS